MRMPARDDRGSPRRYEAARDEVHGPMNDPHETPFHARPDVMVGDIIPFEDAAYQTILARE
jgi:hypothetical protein